MMPTPLDPPPADLIAVTIHPVTATDDEDARNAVPLLYEITIGGIPVWGERVLVHQMHFGSQSAEQYGRGYALAAFGKRLADVLGYNSEDAHA